MRRPGGFIPDQYPSSVSGVVTPKTLFVFVSKSQLHIKAASNLVRYYKNFGHKLTYRNIRWYPVVKNFSQRWEALVDMKEGDVSEVTNITITLTVIIRKE